MSWARPSPEEQRSIIKVASREIAPALNFFFQAEDGIRDLYMTGVQTCALPISRGGRGEHQVGSLVPAVGTLRDHSSPRRSEERRVGKECRSRWSPYH